VLGCISGLKVRVCSFLDLLRGAGMGSLSGTRQEGGGEADPANKLTITENKHGWLRSVHRWRKLVHACEWCGIAPMDPELSVRLRAGEILT
jgi:hypothetical protein